VTEFSPDAMTKLFEAAEWAYREPRWEAPIQAIKAALPAARKEWERMQGIEDRLEGLINKQIKELIDAGDIIARLRSELEAGATPVASEERIAQAIRDNAYAVSDDDRAGAEVDQTSIYAAARAILALMKGGEK